MSHIRVAGQQLEYKWIGPGPDEAPTIVFLHEGLGCTEMWREFPDQVVEATGYGALVYSRAGYGQSDKVALPRTIRFMHDEALTVLPEVLNEFAVREAILLGHSDGGSIALILAGSGNTTKIRALVLVAPHVFVEAISIQSIAQAKENYERGSLKAALEKYHGANVDCAFKGWNDVWLNPDFLSWNIESYLPGIKVPVLVIQGDQDQYGTLQQVTSIENSCAGLVETMVLPQCGHSPHRDQPGPVLEKVSEFLKTHIGLS